VTEQNFQRREASRNVCATNELLVTTVVLALLYT